MATSWSRGAVMKTAAVAAITCRRSPRGSRWRIKKSVSWDRNVSCSKRSPCHPAQTQRRSVLKGRTVQGGNGSLLARARQAISLFRLPENVRRDTDRAVVSGSGVFLFCPAIRAGRIFETSCIVGPLHRWLLGGIGRRTRLKIVRRKASRFDSGRSHHSMAGLCHA